MKPFAFALTLIVGAVSAGAVSIADAADLPVPAPLYVPASPAYNWTGFYLGGNLGAAGNNVGVSDTNGNSFPSTLSISFLGGGQAGANYEFSNGIVIGAEARLDWLPTRNAITALNGPSSATVTISNQWLTLATARLGYAWDRLLVYGKVGGAFVGANAPSLAATTAGATSAVPLAGSPSNWGWTAGAGIEWAFYGNWSTRMELDCIELASRTFTTSATAPFPVTGDSISLDGSSTVNVLFTVGVNYKFGP
jgi:outer membrane immunogenic protein